MAGIVGRTRATLDLREAPDAHSPIFESLGPDLAVNVLEEQPNWLKIKEKDVSGALAGYVPRLGIALPTPESQIFPMIKLDQGQIPAVPRWLKAADLDAWLGVQNGAPNWIPVNLWDSLDQPSQQAVIAGIHAAVAAHQLEWDNWWAEVQANQRQADARLDEWLVMQEGGRNIFAIHAEKIYAQPATDQGDCGWIGTQDIMLWTGRIFHNDQEEKYKSWHEVRLYKYRREVDGWYKSKWLENYIFPEAHNDPDVNANKETVFDLSKPILRFPDDQQVRENMDKGYVAQFVNIKEVINKNLKHTRLCGEFCVAALAGSDIFPLLKQWYAAVPRAKTILEGNESTGTPDLQSILNLYGWQSETFQYSSSVAPTSPARVKEVLMSGKLAIVGVGIYGSGNLGGKIRHWVVLEDIIPVGRSGWVRLYNPYHNREEVYNYSVFIEAVGKLGLGLWVWNN